MARVSIRNFFKRKIVLLERWPIDSTGKSLASQTARYIPLGEEPFGLGAKESRSHRLAHRPDVAHL